MVWIKRNLFWVIFGAMVVVLLGVGGYYLFSGIQANGEADLKLEEIQQKWKRLQSLDPYPNQTNIAIARASQQQLREFVGHASKRFAPIPFRPVVGTEFKRVLDVSIADLQRRAAQHGVQLPTTNYAFSFDEQRNKVQFAQGSIPLLPELVAEVSALCTELFEAKVNRILDLKRPLTADDPSGSTSCHRLPREANQDLGYVQSPYEVIFQGFSSELADVFEHFSTATNCFLVKVVAVHTNAPVAGAVAGDPGAIDPATGLAVGAAPTGPGGTPLRGVPRGTRGPVPGGVRPGRPGTGPAGQGPDAPRTVLNEKLFRVNMLVTVVKPIAK